MNWPGEGDETKDPPTKIQHNRFLIVCSARSATLSLIGQHAESANCYAYIFIVILPSLMKEVIQRELEFVTYVCIQFVH